MLLYRKEWAAVSKQCVSAANSLVNTYSKFGFIDNAYWGTLEDQKEIVRAVGLAHIKMVDELMTILDEQLVALRACYSRLTQAHTTLRTSVYTMWVNLSSEEICEDEYLSELIAWGERVLAMYRKELVPKCVTVDQLARGKEGARDTDVQSEAIGGLGNENGWGLQGADYSADQNAKPPLEPLTDVQLESHVATLMMEPYLDTAVLDEVSNMITAKLESMT